MLVRREQDSKCFPQLFLGSILGGALVSYWPIVFLSLVRIPENNCEGKTTTTNQ